MDAITEAYDGDILMIDSALIRARQQPATAKKAGRDHCLGRSRGGLTTKIHAVVDRKGLPLRLGLTAGQAHDAAIARMLLDRLAPRAIVPGDKAYDGHAIRDLIAKHKVRCPASRPSRTASGNPASREHSISDAIRSSFLSKLKHIWRIATRYDQRSDKCLAMVTLASMRLWMPAYQSTA
jgi:transposase